jgi:hypothetical protein
MLLGANQKHHKNNYGIAFSKNTIGVWIFL